MRPIFRLIFALLITVVVCQTLVYFMKYGLTKFNNHKQERLTELLLNKTKYDVLFLGSSRTHTSINPLVFDKVTNLNSYNAGVEGGNIYEFKLILDSYLLNHPPPKFLVLTLDLHSFNLKRKLFNYTQYYSFIENEKIEEALVDNGNNPMLFKIIPFLELTEYDDYTRSNAIMGLLGKTEIPAGEDQYKGFLTNTTKFISKNINLNGNRRKLKVDQEGINLLRKIVQNCRDNNINLILTYAPEFKGKLQKDAFNSSYILNYISEIADENHVPFLRHDQLEICDNNKLFANPGHLNRIGANIYSAILGEEIKKLKDKYKVI